MSVTVETSETESPAVPTHAEGVELLDRQARRLLGISGDEFLRRWDGGEFSELDDTPETRKIMYVGLLIPFGRRNP